MSKINLNIDLDRVVLESLEKSGLKRAKEQLDESYVAEPKKYGQVSEFATQKTKDAHYALYEKAVQDLNRVSAELDNHGAENWGELKSEESFLLNKVWLHELFFANCFDPHSEVYMDSITYLRLERDFGSFEEWQKCFINCAMTVQNGWAVTGYHMFLKRYITVPIEGNTGDVPVGFYPIIVLDCHEHSYWKDYLGDRKNYVVAFMRELAWNIINERTTRVEKIAEVLK